MLQHSSVVNYLISRRLIAKIVAKGFMIQNFSVISWGSMCVKITAQTRAYPILALLTQFFLLTGVF